MKKFLITIVFGILLFLTGCNSSTTYKITYVLNGGTAINLVTEYEEDDIVIFPEATKEGYFFDGWYASATFDDEPVRMLEGKIKEDVTVYAKFRVITYTVDYVLNGGEFIDEPNTDGNYEDNLVLSIPTKEGYTFLGWYKDREFNGDAITEIPAHYKQNISVYAAWGRNISTVTYMLGDIFDSKEDLFTSFFTDFYNYIVDYKKAGSSLKSQGVNSVEDFLEAASYYDASSGAGMGKIGNLAGSYYLTKNVGGKLENQTSSSFIGWCLANNRYVDFIYFMEEFFYWWRLDEGYTNGPDDPQGTGSDFLASPWASLVDTAKFFYFTKETLPTYFISKGHVSAMYDKIPGLIISKRGTLETEYNSQYGLGISFELTITGKRLVGWTLTQGDTTNVITSLEPGIYQDIILYPVWEEIE